MSSDKQGDRTQAVMDAFHRRWGLSDHMLPLTRQQMRELAEHPDPNTRLKEFAREYFAQKEKEQTSCNCSS
jgi:hypothetical protein